MDAVRAAEDDGEYFDEEAVRVLRAMLGACERPKFVVNVGNSVRYVSE